MTPQADGLLNDGRGGRPQRDCSRVGRQAPSAQALAAPVPCLGFVPDRLGA
jgi:hypothetical protein